MAQPEFWQRQTLDKNTTVQTGIRNWMRRTGLREQALLYLFALGLAELLVSIWEPRVGMVMHGAILIALLLHGTLFARGLWQKFLIALTLAPLIRLLSLTMPLPSFPYLYWYLVVGAPLFIATFLVMRFSRLTPPMVGLMRSHPIWQVMVGLTGIGFGLVEYLILRPDPLVQQLTWQDIWIPALILLVFTGFLEELIFRGVMQYSALRRFGRFGMLYVAMVFTVLHIGYLSILDLIFVLGVAIFFAYVVQRTGSILGVSISHGLINIGLFLIFPFLLAKPVEQLPSPPEIVAPRPAFSGTATMVHARTPTSSLSPSPTNTPIPPTKTRTPTSRATTIAPSDTLVPTATVCTPQTGWSTYQVRFGETWRRVARRYGMTAQSLKQANCLDDGTALVTGQFIYVPYRITTQTIVPITRPKTKSRDGGGANPTPTLVDMQPTMRAATPEAGSPPNTPSIPPTSPILPSQPPIRPTLAPP